jgi:hypothetical protein
VSLSEEQPITCPGCNATSAARIHRSVNVTTEPALKEQLLTGRLFTFTCPSCGRPTRVVHPELVYQDVRGGYLLQMDALGRFDAASLRGLEGSLPGVTRVVRDSNALLEKVKVFDAGLDDRVIEVLKLVLVSSQQAGDTAMRYLFEGTGTPSHPEGRDLRFTVLSSKGISGMAVPRTAYEDLRARLESAGKLGPLSAWAVVDAEYARLALET